MNEEKEREEIFDEILINLFHHGLCYHCGKKVTMKQLRNYGEGDVGICIECVNK